MSTDPDLDRYFTEQVISRPFVVTMGPSAKPRQSSRHGLLVDWARNRMRLTRLAARTLVVRDTASVLIGEPLALGALQKLRWGLVLGAWLLWSVLLVALCLFLVEWRP
jgi:hypothetical protein